MHFLAAIAMNWKAPATMDKTLEAWQRFRKVMDKNGGLAVLHRYTGITDESLRWMAEHEPFMPWSADLCEFVMSIDLRNVARGRYLVSTEPLAERLRNLNWYGYSFREIAHTSGVSHTIVRQIANGDYPMTTPDKHDKIMRAVKIYEAQQRREVRDMMKSGMKWRA